MDALKMLKDSISDLTKKWAIETPLSIDEESKFARVNGVPSFVVAQDNNIEPKVMLKKFYNLEKQGKVYRHFVYQGLTRWWPVGFMAELRQQESNQ